VEYHGKCNDERRDQCESIYINSADDAENMANKGDAFATWYEEELRSRYAQHQRRTRSRKSGGFLFRIFFSSVQSEVGFSRFLIQTALFGKFDQGWTVRIEWLLMPPRMVIHKGLNGVPNGWAPRFWGLWGTALLEAAGFALFVLLVELHARGTIAFNGDKHGQYASGKWILWVVSIVWSFVFFGVQIFLVGWNRV